MADQWNSRLSEYLDGDLDEAERAMCDRHLASCATCRSTLDELRQVVARAQALTDERPAVDLWPGLRAGLQRPPAMTLRKVFHVRFSFTLPHVAAAAVLLAVIGAASAWLAQSRRQVAPPQLATTAPQGVGTVTRASFADKSYDRAIADLERTLAQRRAELDPTTVAAIERSLRVIDRAIAEASKALESDPGNVYLNGYFAAARQRKLDLLRRVSALAHTEG